jgi:hypothetical protein
MEDAEFARDRLRTVQPRLQARLAEAQAAEYAARWQADYEHVKAERDALAAELRETYPGVVKQLVNLFGRIVQVDTNVSRINISAPYGDHRRLLGVELTARKLDNFTTASPSVAEELQLPDWERSTVLAWPVPHRPLFSPGMVPLMPHADANWAEALEARDRARAEESQRVLAYYAAQAKAREEREAAEALGEQIPS